MESGNDWFHFQPKIPFTQSVSPLLYFCYILRLLRFNNQSRKISIKAGNTPINRNLNFKQYTKFYGPTRASNYTTTIGKGLLNMETIITNASLEHL